MLSDLTNKYLSPYLLWPEKFQSGCHQAKDFLSPQAIREKLLNIKRFICIGMGGSIAAGHILQSIVQNHCGKDYVLACDPFSLPQKKTKDDLFILISHSGNTWEVLFAFENLCKIDANILILSCGGQLLERAEAQKIDYCKISTNDAPREDLPIFLGFLLSIITFSKETSPPIVEPVKSAIAAVMKIYQKALPDQNFLDIFSKVSAFHIWAVGQDSYLPAIRARNQFAENSKVSAILGVIPDVFHNLLATFQTETTISVLFFHTRHLDSRLEKAIVCVKKLLSERGVALYSAPILGNNWIEQMISLVIWADFASIWLAELKGCDPRSIVLLDELKQEIGKNRLI